MPSNGTVTETSPTAKIAIEFAKQAERLGQYKTDQEPDGSKPTQAVEAKFVTPQDPVIEIADGGRLPAVPLEEALKLNQLRDLLEGRDPNGRELPKSTTRAGRDGTVHGSLSPNLRGHTQSTAAEAPLRKAVAPARTNPLFPPLPTFGPPSFLRDTHSWMFRISSGLLSFLFLLIIILGALFTSIPGAYRHIACRMSGEDPLVGRPFYEEEKFRGKERLREEKEWNDAQKRPQTLASTDGILEESNHTTFDDQFIPTEGGPDPLICDVAYYARRVGLDCEIYEVQTEDGFVLELFHLYNPLTTSPRSESERAHRSPDNFTQDTASVPKGASKKYPVLLIHGLLQSPGAYCCSGRTSLAFLLAFAGYDVWLGSNRCGFRPKHTRLQPSDPRMWAWNIRQMGVMDLPALISRVLAETDFPKLALVAHSQGTAQTLVALAKEQRPDMGQRISICCLLAPAAYAGPLIEKMQFKFMQIIGVGMFRAMFGIHSFIPFMMSMHKILPGKMYGFMGYKVFSFLFKWSDKRWDRGLRDRFFQFSPVYVSAESMRWWLGRECFASQRCILATREEARIEDVEDEDLEEKEHTHADPEELERYAWYDKQVPPFAMWIGGSDALVDGKKLLRRFERGREPFVNLVHSRVIEEYEHLDVLWAMDSVEKVGKEVIKCIWETIPENIKTGCKAPVGLDAKFTNFHEKDSIPSP
jgi:pimeloyl-ACP methyl ester carboxylesterase